MYFVSTKCTPMFYIIINKKYTRNRIVGHFLQPEGIVKLGQDFITYLRFDLRTT